MVRGRTTKSLSYEILIFVPPPFLFYVTIKGMDKIIKTISENGAFRAYVLDSTETVRTAQEKHQTLASSTVALGRTLIASQILAANEKVQPVKCWLDHSLEMANFSLLRIMELEIPIIL